MLFFRSKTPEFVPKSGMESLLDWIEDCSKYPEMWSPYPDNWDKQNQGLSNPGYQAGIIEGVLLDSEEREARWGCLKAGGQCLRLQVDGSILMERASQYRKDFRYDPPLAYYAHYFFPLTPEEKARVKRAVENILAAKAIQLLITKYSELTEKDTDDPQG